MSNLPWYYDIFNPEIFNNERKESMTNEEALAILKEPDRIGYNIINTNDEETTKYNLDSQMALSMAIHALEDKRIGHWVYKTVRGEQVPCCSRCGLDNGTHYEYNFCPECGAKMVESQESEVKK